MIVTSLEIHTAIGSRLLVGMLCDPQVLALCDDVEVTDFHHPWHRVAFRALRDLQARGAPVDITPVCDEIRRRDAATGRHESVFVDELYLCELALSVRSYRTDYTVEKIDGITHVNGEPVDWRAYIDTIAKLDSLFGRSPLTAFEFTDEQRRDLKHYLVRSDAAALRFHRDHAEEIYRDEPTAEASPEIPDGRERVLAGASPRHGRARRATC